MNPKNEMSNEPQNDGYIINIPKSVEFVPQTFPRNQKPGPLLVEIAGPVEYVRPRELEPQPEKQEPLPLLHAEIANEMMEAHSLPSSRRLIPRTYNGFLKECGEWIVDRRILWYGDPEDKVWTPIRNIDEFQGLLATRGWEVGEDVRSIYNRVLADKSFRHRNPFKQQCVAEISFADGILNVETGDFRERCLADRYTYRLSLDYTQCDRPWRLDTFIKVIEILAGSTSSAMRLQELCGMALSARPAGDLLLVICGNRRWATLFPKFLAQVTDADFISFLSLRDHDRSFRTTDAIGKHLLLSFMEGEAFVRDLETVLRLIDGDGINADRKFLPNVDFLAQTTLFAAGRRLPRVRDSSILDALDYISSVELEGVFPYELMSIPAFLSCEAEFITWSVEGLRRYLKNGRYTVAGNVSQDPRKILDEFLEASVVADANCSVSSESLLTAYEAFCENRECCQLSRYDVLQAIRERFGLYSSTVRVPSPNGGSRTCSGYRGLTLRKAVDEIASTSTCSDELSIDYETSEDGEFGVEFESGAGLLGEIEAE